jgi:hypothetical protein
MGGGAGRTSGTFRSPAVPRLHSIPENDIQVTEVRRMWETRSVQLTVRLPRDIAAQAEEVQLNDPEFLSRVILYGLNRRSIYRHLREQQEEISASPSMSSEPQPVS